MSRRSWLLAEVLDCGLGLIRLVVRFWMRFWGHRWFDMLLAGAFALAAPPVLESEWFARVIVEPLGHILGVG